MRASGLHKILLVVAMIAPAIAHSAGGAASGWGVHGGNGLVGYQMTWQTVDYMSRMVMFEGLDPAIPWRRFYIDPYAGDDANSGGYDDPIRTLGEWKRRATFGSWFVVKNRDRDPVFSNRTFSYFVEAGACRIDETVMHDSGQLSRILDIDPNHRVVVFETLGSVRLESDSQFVGQESGCRWRTAERTPTIWDETTTVCHTDPARVCQVGPQCPRSGPCPTHCLAGSICVGAASASIVLDETPPSYQGRVVTVIAPEDPRRQIRVHGDGQPLSVVSTDRQGLFIALGNDSYGCLGVVGFHGERIRDDFVSQHEEGCVRTLNVGAFQIVNVNGDINNNVFTTHGGTAGRGGLITVNGYGSTDVHSVLAGSPIAPTGASYSIHIGRGRIESNLENQIDLGTTSPLSSTGGRIWIVGHEFACVNLRAGANGCHGASVYASSTAATSFTAIRAIFRHAGLPSLSGVKLQAVTGRSLSAKLYQVTSTGGRLITTISDRGPIDLDVRGAIFANADYYVFDYSNSLGSVNAVVDGVFDEDGLPRFFFKRMPIITVDEARTIAGQSWSLFTRSSRQTDSEEFIDDGSLACAPTGECFRKYDETYSTASPVVIWDYLSRGITGFTESGIRNFGAR